jgi:hypothetical protein
MDDGHIELFALCDECEALWLDPALAPEDYYFSDAIEPLCPRSGQPLYGPDSWWATREFVQETPWAIHLPPDAAASGESLPPDSAEDPSPDPPDESA